MTERKYSISEIDEMRKYVGWMFPLGHQKTVKEVEERLRTYMLNGTEPFELELAAEEYSKRRKEDFDIHLAMRSGNFAKVAKLRSERSGL